MPAFTGNELCCLRGQRLVFVGLEFRIEAGQALLLTGPNGSGKSSLLRLMATLLRPWRGRLEWDGVAVREEADNHRARLRYVGHLDGVKPVLSVREMLEFWARLDHGPDPAARAARALSCYELETLSDTPGRYLSAGQKRRLNLARLALMPAALWLLDEPTNGLDRASVARFESEMAAHRAAGGMIAVSSHTDLELPGAAELRLGDFTPALGVADDEEEEA